MTRFPLRRAILGGVLASAAVMPMIAPMPAYAQFGGIVYDPTIFVRGSIEAVVHTLFEALVLLLCQQMTFAAAARLVGVSPEDASWLVTATLLAGAVATPSLARLADMYGKRRMMLASLAAMTLGSVIAALSSSLGVLITARALQGFGMALIPIAISIMRDEIPRERLGSAVALVSATLGVGAAVGLPLSGFVYEHLGWHALFWISAALGAIVAVAVRVVIPESRLRSGGTFDIVGALLLSGVLVGLLLGITKGGTWGWANERTLLCFSAAAALLAVWLPWELRVRQPLVDVRTSARRPVLLTNIASFLAGFAMYCNMLTTTELLQIPTSTGYGFGLAVTTAGLAMLPAGLTMVVMAPVSAAITRRFGAKVTLMVGAGALAAGYLLRVFLMAEVWQIVLGAIVVSTGTAISYAAMPILIMRAVPATETAAANGLNMVLRSVGTSTASAAVAAVLTTVTMTVGGIAYPSQQAFQHVFVLAAIAVDALGIFVSALAVIVVGALLGAPLSGGVPGVLLAALLAALFGSGVSAASAAAVMRTGKAELAGTIGSVVFMLLFLAPTFVPRELMGARWIQAVAAWNPLTYLMAAMRHLVSGIDSPAALAPAFAIALAAGLGGTIAAALSVRKVLS